MDRASAAETTLPEKPRKCICMASAHPRRRPSPARRAPPRRCHQRCTPRARWWAAPRGVKHLYQGGEIDSHDAVFRTNAHALGAHATKTTVRVAANAKQLAAAATRRRTQNLVRRRRAACPRATSSGNATAWRACPHAGSMPSTPTAACGLQSTYSSGLAIGLALHSCASVALYEVAVCTWTDPCSATDSTTARRGGGIRRLVAEHRVADRTDRGVHLRRCETWRCSTTSRRTPTPAGSRCRRSAHARRLNAGTRRSLQDFLRAFRRASSDTADATRSSSSAKTSRRARDARAWVTMCVQHNAAKAGIVRMCAASIASFLVASNTSEHARAARRPRRARARFAR